MSKNISDVILIISDIHANLEAFNSVLRHSDGLHSEVWILGDITGYGPNPVECLQLARKINSKMIAGNHDLAVSGKIDVQSFNNIARMVIEKHREELGDEDKQFLYNLPPKLLEDSITLAHGSPRNPVWEYVTDTFTATKIFAQTQSPLTFIGHSHLPLLWTSTINRPVFQEDTRPKSRHNLKGKLAIANPGSVGQPRNGNPKACYMLLNLRQKILSFHSCSWNKRKTRHKMLTKGYPLELVDFMAPSR